MAPKVWGNEYRTTTVCIDSYADGILSGRFYNPYLENSMAFKSLTQFLVEMEQMLDLMNFPQSFSATRTFAPSPTQKTGPPGAEHQTGKLATFAVRIIFRQNASWQGSVTWLDSGQEQSFRSALELILLMDNALTSTS